jgi:hypothetical protein
MTLLLTEIHCPTAELSESIIVFAADRRISSGGRHHASKMKLFEVPKFRGGIGFFGLAEFSVGRKRVSISDWLKRFRETKAGMSVSLTDFAERLAEELNHLVCLDNGVRNHFVCGRGVGRDGCR